MPILLALKPVYLSFDLRRVYVLFCYLSYTILSPKGLNHPVHQRYTIQTVIAGQNNAQQPYFGPINHILCCHASSK